LGADYHGRMIDLFEAFASGRKGNIYSDPRTSHFLRLRTLVASGTFCLLFAAVGKK
jgi:hypothetical protein